MHFNMLQKNKKNDSQELKFIKSGAQKELLKPILVNWSVSNDELKTLYSYNYVTLKNSNLKFVTFPISFWFTAIFSCVQLFIFSVFLLAFLTSDSTALISYAIGISSMCLIVMVFYLINQSMVKPVNILLKNYHHWGKYNNF